MSKSNASAVAFVNLFSQPAPRVRPKQYGTVAVYSPADAAQFLNERRQEQNEFLHNGLMTNPEKFITELAENTIFDYFIID